MNIHDIAREAGVSTATVSRVIHNALHVSPQTKARVERVIEKYNFTPNALAAGLLKNATNSIGVLCTDIRIPHYAQIVENIESRLSDVGYTTFLCNTGGSYEKKLKYFDALTQKRVDALILVGSVYHEGHGNEHIEKAARRTPVVLVNNVMEGDNIYSITTDYRAEMLRSVEYAVEKGRSRFLFAVGNRSFAGIQKIQGLREAIRRFDLSPEAYRFVDVRVKKYYDFEDEIPQVTATLLRAREQISYDAIITDNDLIGNMALHSLKSMALRVPEDVGVVGFNNSVICQYSEPTLTSVDIKEAQIGRLAAELCHKVLSQTPPVHAILTLQGVVVPRQSL